jgi:hypothetical protein
VRSCPVDDPHPEGEGLDTEMPQIIGALFSFIISRDFDTQRVGLRLRSRDGSACSKSLTTMFGVFLLVWTTHCSIGTIHTAIVGFWEQNLPAGRAFVEKLAGIDWHNLFLTKSAEGA